MELEIASVPKRAVFSGTMFTIVFAISWALRTLIFIFERKGVAKTSFNLRLAKTRTFSCAIMSSYIPARTSLLNAKCTKATVSSRVLSSCWTIQFHKSRNLSAI